MHVCLIRYTYATACLVDSGVKTGSLINARGEACKHIQGPLSGEGNGAYPIVQFRTGGVQFRFYGRFDWSFHYVVPRSVYAESPNATRNFRLIGEFSGSRLESVRSSLAVRMRLRTKKNL